MKSFLRILLSFVAAVQVSAGDTPVRLIAHRGGVVDDQIIENNRAYIEAAVERGYWMLEVDVRRTRDNVPIAHHDSTFQRYYEDRRSVGDLSWNEVSVLRANPGGESPLRLSDYLAVCDGRVRIMLDIKSEKSPLPEKFLQEIERVMREHGQLDQAYLIGAEEARQYFLGKLRVSGGYDDIVAARKRGEDVDSRYFYFPRGRTFTSDDIVRALQLGVPVVPSINTFHYPAAERMTQAREDIDRMRRGEVTEFQIDSIYDQWLLDE